LVESRGQCRVLHLTIVRRFGFCRWLIASAPLRLLRIVALRHGRRGSTDVLKSLGLTPKKLPSNPPEKARRALWGLRAGDGPDKLAVPGGLVL